jgi:hypothetical protein
MRSGTPSRTDRSPFGGLGHGGSIPAYHDREWGNGVGGIPSIPSVAAERAEDSRRHCSRFVPSARAMVQRHGERRCGNQTTMPQAPEAALVAWVVGCNAGCSVHRGWAAGVRAAVPGTIRALAEPPCGVKTWLKRLGSADACHLSRALGTVVCCPQQCPRRHRPDCAVTPSQSAALMPRVLDPFGCCRRNGRTPSDALPRS